MNLCFQEEISHHTQARLPMSCRDLITDCLSKKQKRPRDFSLSRLKWWPPCESNTAPTDYESAALTKHELGGRKPLIIYMSDFYYGF